MNFIINNFGSASAYSAVKAPRPCAWLAASGSQHALPVGRLMSASAHTAMGRNSLWHRYAKLCLDLHASCRQLPLDTTETLALLRRYARIGSIVMLLHDPSDIFLEAAKLASYAGAEAPSTLLFTALLLTWCSLRLGLLPFWVIRSALCEPPDLQGLGQW